MNSTLKKALKNRWLPLIVLIIGVVLAGIVAATGPEAPRRTRQRQARLVEVAPLEALDTQVTVKALGTVQPALEVQLQAQVSGQIMGVGSGVIPGGLAAEGEALFRIDPREYEFAVRQRESDVARAQQALKLEESQQAIAAREYELLGEVVGDDDAELVLRKPQLETAQAAHDAALAALEQARLNLDRTAVTSPFNAMIEDRLVDRGTVVTPNSVLATLVGTDACWVEVMVPVDDLPWIDVPRGDGSGGSATRIRQDATWEDGVWRDGRVLGRSGSLDGQGRMIKVIVEVPDPFSLKRANAAEPVLLMGSFVDVEIVGRVVHEAVVVERSHVHDGNTVWLMDDEGNLDVRVIDPIYAGEDQVLVTKGLEQGELLVISSLSAPVDGMPLRVRDGEPSRGEEGTAESGGGNDAGRTQAEASESVDDNGGGEGAKTR